MLAKLINKNIICFSSDIKYEVASSFVRMAEFYESPFEHIRGHHFSLDTYMDTYARANSDQFTYFEDWEGFNFPGESVLKFMDLFADDIRRKEYTILNTILANINISQKFYVIATTGDRALNHEYAHALYYINPEYRVACDNIYEKMSKKALYNIHKYLKDKGYTEFTFKDETQAYLGTTTDEELPEEFDEGELASYLSAIKQFRKVFENAPKMDITPL